MTAHLFGARTAALVLAAAAILGISSVSVDARDGGNRFYQRGGMRGFPVGRPMPVGRPIDVNRNFDSRQRMRFAGGDRSHFDRRDYRGGRNSGFGNSKGFGNGNSNGFGNWNGNGFGYARNYGGNRPYPIQRFGLIGSNNYGYGGNSITVITNRPDLVSNGTYAGSNSIYFTGGGAYLNSYGNVRTTSSDTLRPRSRIIDVATMSDVCSHEGGVCVIRP